MSSGVTPTDEFQSTLPLRGVTMLAVDDSGGV